jgi:hypothetical protein
MMTVPSKHGHYFATVEDGPVGINVQVFRKGFRGAPTSCIHTDILLTVFHVALDMMVDLVNELEHNHEWPIGATAITLH